MPDDGLRPASPIAGWLLIDSGGAVRRADAAACALLGLSETGSVLGRDARSLVARGDRGRWPEPSPGPGSTWAGVIRFDVAGLAVALAVEMVGLISGEGWAVRLAATPGSVTPDLPMPAIRAAADAPLAAADAIEDSASGGAASRAVLQALDAAIPLDFACVLEFADDGASVVAVYPTPMAGVAAGDTWASLDDAEASVRTRGEPALEGDMAAAHAAVPFRTPLGRLPAFGLRSRLHIPLFAGAEVAGVALLYRRGARAFSAADGWLAERTLRRLGPRLHLSPAAEGSADAGLDAVARFDALGDLVAGAAHELNNPLTSILGYAQILDSLEGADREHALHTIEEESQRAARIMRNLLQFARQEPEPPTLPAGVQLPLGPGIPQRTVAPTPETHEPGTPTGAPSTAAARIMVIDGDPTNLAATSAALSAAGYEVNTAPDGAEGAECLRGGGYSAVIADVALRGLDASTFAAWILAHRAELSERIILVTDDPEGRRATLPPGVRARYLRKPFDVPALLAALGDVLVPARVTTSGQ
ncbi:MAG: response regulator [Dehalococcoidia bacterium]|nr:MAG: response regulator [Dehalococcoidia bacterium]